MYDRLLDAVKKLKESQDELQLEFKQIRKEWDKDNNFYLQKLMRKMEEDLTNYTIQDGYWFYNGVNTGVKAEGIDGEDGEAGPQGETGNGIESITKTDSTGLVDTYTISYTDGTFSQYNVRNGKDGKDGKRGLQGETGRTGAPGRDGKDGAPGRDGISPIIKIGNIEVSPEYGGASAKLRKGRKENIFYLDLVLPRGPQGFTGFDGKQGDPGPKGDPGVQGDPGRGISTITKTGTSGSVDTYTITYTDGTTSTYQVTNGEVTQAQLDETNKELDYYKTLYNAMPKLTGTGTEATIDDTAESVLKMDLSGNTYQESTTGKNLVDFETQSFTTYKDYTGLNISAGTYTFSSLVTSSDTSQQTSRVYFYGESGGTDQVFINLSRNTRANATVTTTFDIKRIVLYSSIDYTSSNGKTATYKDIQLESGSTATSYEPYTGGQASPNPDYPQDIEVVTGDNEIVVGNKNLFDKDNVITGKYYNSNGVLANETNSYCQLINVNESEKYSLKITNNFGSTVRLNIFVFDNTMQRLAQIRWGDGLASGSNYTNQNYTMPSGAKYITISVTDASPTSENINKIPIQLEKGSTATDYVEHKEQTYPINLGNLELCKIGDYKDSFRQSSGKNLLENMTIYNINHYVSPLLKLNKGTYTFHYEGTNAPGVYVRKNDGSKPTNGTEVSHNYNATNITFTVDNGEYYIHLYSDTNWESLTMEDPQLEQGSTATEYEPYGVGTWYKHAEIDKVVLDGSETWGIQNNCLRTDFTNIKKEEYGSSTILIYSYYYKGALTNYRDGIPNGCIAKVIGDNNQVGIKDTSYASETSFKTWLSTHNMLTYYILATPTNTEITDTNLINQLNALKYALAYKDQTNISQTNDEQPFIIDYETLYDMQKLVGA